MVTKVHDDTLRAGKIFGQANAIYATGHPLSKDAKFFQNGPASDGWKPGGWRATRALLRRARKTRPAKRRSR